MITMRGWHQSSSVAAKAAFFIPLQLTKTTDVSSRRFSMVGSAIASALLANAVATSSITTSSSSSCKCESDGRNVVDTKVSPWYQDPTIAISAPLMETITPLSTKSVGITHTAAQHRNIGNVNTPHPTVPYPMQTRTWWRLRWWWKDGSWRSQRNHPTLWWKRVGQSFFVITRGIEIVVRLSPLIILTPSAMIVSYVDTMWRRVFWYKWWRRSNHNGLPLTTSPVVLQLGDLQAHEDDIYTTQFHDETNTPSSSLHHHNCQTATSWASNIAWSYTLHTLQCLGPAFVKLGQWAATRRDLFPVHVCNRLAELQDTARVHDWKYTHQALVDAFGTDYEQRGLVLRSNTSTTANDNSNRNNSNKNSKEERNVNHSGILGSGCAAQVHIGTLHNKTVAVKVLHPHTRSSIQRDLALLQHVADFIDNCIPLNVVKMLSLPRAVSNFADIMTGQVDMRVEGDNLRVFRDNFGCTDHHDNTHNNPHQTITFPYPESEWVSEHVLVEEYAGVDAFPISRYLHDTSSDGLKTRKELAGILLRAFLKMVFIDNFIHADLHPGNVLVRAIPMKSNPKKVKYNIIFIDAGIATSLQPNDRKNLHDLFKAIVLNDGYTAGQLMIERARYERCTSIPGGAHAFATGVAHIVSEFHDRRKQGLTLGAVRVGALLGRVLDLCRRYQVEIDPAMSSVVVSMLVLEGLGRSLDPDLNLMKAAMPFLIGKV